MFQASVHTLQSPTVLVGHQISTINSAHLDEYLDTILEWIQEESKYLLTQTRDGLRKQISKGLSVIILDGNNIAAHATAWELLTGHYEIGTVIVGKSYRQRGFTHTLFTNLLSLLAKHHVLCTSTNEYCVMGAEKVGMHPRSFDELPQDVRIATCCCSPEKMKAPCFTNCQLKDRVCTLLSNMAS